jgi:hypothetical protein
VIALLFAIAWAVSRLALEFNVQIVPDRTAEEKWRTDWSLRLIDVLWVPGSSSSLRHLDPCTRYYGRGVSTIRSVDVGYQRPRMGAARISARAQ